MVEEVTLINKSLGTSLFISMHTREYVLEEVDWGSIESSNTSYKFLNQVGVYVTETSLETRTISILGWVVADSINDMERRKQFLNRFVNPLQRIVLYYKNYQIEGIPDGTIKYGTSYPENNEIICKFLIRLFCPDPTFYTKNSRVISVARWIPKLRFPLQTRKDKKLIFGLRSPSTIATIVNDGSLPCGFVVTLQASGQVENPKLIDIQTQQELRFDHTMNANETIEVSTLQNHKTVKKTIQGVTENAFNLLDLVHSTFFPLAVGENFIRYAADSGVDNLSVTIQYDPRYLEVQE